MSRSLQCFLCMDGKAQNKGKLKAHGSPFLFHFIHRFHLMPLSSGRTWTLDRSHGVD
jgi:hypothetical protein